MNTADRKIFGTLFFSIFASVTGVGIVVPLLPVYANSLGASGIYIGLIFGAFSLSRTLFLPYFGRKSDIKGRKPFIVAGLFSYAVISIAFVLSNGVEALIIIRFIQGITSAMIMPVVQAYVGDITPRGKEGWIMGLFNMSLFIGLSLGPVIGGVVKDNLGLDWAFVCMGMLSCIGYLLSILFLPPRNQELVATKVRPPAAWSTILSDKSIGGLFFFRFSYTSCIGIIWGFLPVFATVEFSTSASDNGILVMLGIFISGLVQIPMGWLADRINRKAMVITGGLIVSGSVYTFIHATGFKDLFWTSIVFGLGGGIANPALMAAAVQQGSRLEAMGSVISLLTAGHSSGMLAGSVLAGIMMDWFQLRQAFVLGALIMAAGTLLFVLFSWNTRLNEERIPTTPSQLPEG